MVYCTKCGTENADDANVCINCGASLNPPTYRASRDRGDNCFGGRRSKEDDMCFGGRSSQTWPLLIGVFIILMGLSFLLEDTYYWARFDNLWPIFIIAIGLIIVTNAFQRR